MSKYSLGQNKKINKSKKNKIKSFSYSSYPDFTDGAVQHFAIVGFPEGDGIELALVEVRHSAIARLLSERLGGF